MWSTLNTWHTGCRLTLWGHLTTLFPVSTFPCSTIYLQVWYLLPVKHSHTWCWLWEPSNTPLPHTHPPPFNQLLTVLACGSCEALCTHTWCRLTVWSHLTSTSIETRVRCSTQVNSCKFIIDKNMISIRSSLKPYKSESAWFSDRQNPFCSPIYMCFWNFSI